MSVQERETLIVENAILKHNEQVRGMLKEELAPFSKAIKELDTRMDAVEKEVTNIKEVVEPFSKLRRRLWFLLIAVSLTVSVLAEKVSSFISNTFIK
jgi:hypothetical protein